MVTDAKSLCGCCFGWAKRACVQHPTSKSKRIWYLNTAQHDPTGPANLSYCRYSETIPTTTERIATLILFEVVVFICKSTLYGVSWIYIEPANFDDCNPGQTLFSLQFGGSLHLAAPQ